MNVAEIKEELLAACEDLNFSNLNDCHFALACGIVGYLKAAIMHEKTKSGLRSSICKYQYLHLLKQKTMSFIKANFDRIENMDQKDKNMYVFISAYEVGERTKIEKDALDCLSYGFICI